MSKSLAFLSTFLLVILTIDAQPVATNFPNGIESSGLDRMSVTESQKLMAREAVAVCIRQVSETKKMVDSLLGRKSFLMTAGANQLRPCVTALRTELSSMTSTLQRLQRLDSMTRDADVKSLEKTLVHAGTMCDQSIHVDSIVPSMLTKKLDDLSAAIDDVVYHVSAMEGEIDGAGNGGNA